MAEPARCATQSSNLNHGQRLFARRRRRKPTAVRPPHGHSFPSLACLWRTGSGQACQHDASRQMTPNGTYLAAELGGLLRPPLQNHRSHLFECRIVLQPFELHELPLGIHAQPAQRTMRVIDVVSNVLAVPGGLRVVCSWRSARSHARQSAGGTYVCNAPEVGTRRFLAPRVL